MNHGYLRQFETIGGLGGSMVVATGADEARSNLPPMAGARQIVGVPSEGG